MGLRDVQKIAADNTRYQGFNYALRHNGQCKPDHIYGRATTVYLWHQSQVES